MISRSEVESMIEALREELTLRENDGQYMVDRDAGGQTLQLTGLVADAPEEGGGGIDPYYFEATKLNDNTIQVLNLLLRYGNEMRPVINFANVTIPNVDGTYYVYMEVTYLASYNFTAQCSELDTHPDQENTGVGARAWREEIAEITITDTVISGFTQIWPGHVMSIEGRVL
jgi:hypothetical protein